MIVVSIVASSLAVIVSFWGPRWMRVSISIILFWLFLHNVVFEVGSAARDSVRPELEKIELSTDYLDGVKAFRDELDPVMVAIVILVFGLLVIGVSRKN